MTPEEIIEMVNESYGPITGKWWDMDIASMERFAKLAVAKEREACAKVCDDWYETRGLYGVDKLAAAIRARGEA